MSWLEKLYQTYEQGVLLDLPIDRQIMPISHTVQNAHINIVIDSAGNFRRASVLEKTQIVLPATESSASRSGKDAPSHPLADKIQYIAKDYPDYGGAKPSYFDGYLQQLSSWCQSDFAHPKVMAVWRYVSKGDVVTDLIANNILYVDRGNVLLTRWPADVEDEQPLIFKALPKDNGLLDQGNALVCWTVESDGDSCSDTWKDGSIQKSWIAYDATRVMLIGTCMITGAKLPLATNHPAKIRHSGDKAKLISSNDTSGYTYRGRFLDALQSCSISFEASQKAHNVLRWLINRQGFKNGEQTFVAWATLGGDVPELLSDSWSFLRSEDSEISIQNSVADEKCPDIDHTIDLGEEYSHKLRSYLAGYSSKLSPSEQICVLGLDSATPGRMGITYYRELFKDDFFNRLEAWHRDFAWLHRHTVPVPSAGKKKELSVTTWSVSSPIPKDIAIAAYGEKVDDKLRKAVVERLVPCIVDQQQLPLDLLRSCVSKAIKRGSFNHDKLWLWEKALSTACALYRGYYRRHSDESQRRDYAMALDENVKNRDYLYGRLLALAERIEEIALGVSGEERSTTAARLMQRFADRPCETWRNIELALQPYIQRLRISRAGFLSKRLNELDEILSSFENGEFESNRPLSGEFLLGYHCQRQKLREKREITNKNIEEGLPA